MIKLAATITADLAVFGLLLFWTAFEVLILRRHVTDPVEGED